MCHVSVMQVLTQLSFFLFCCKLCKWYIWWMYMTYSVTIICLADEGYTLLLNLVKSDQGHVSFGTQRVCIIDIYIDNGNCWRANHFWLFKIHMYSHSFCKPWWRFQEHYITKAHHLFVMYPQAFNTVLYSHTANWKIKLT